MQNSNPYLSVIIPAYNEERRIETTLLSIYDYLSHQTFSWEILIVLDGSTDNTFGLVRDLAETREQIRWIYRADNRGKGYTVREGMLASKGQIRLFTDADNSTDINHFEQMQPFFEDGYEVVICSRDRKDAEGAGQAVPQPALKRFLGNAGNVFIQIFAVPGIWDTQCGFKAFTAEAAEKIFGVSKIDGWGFDIEALALARHFGYQIAVIGARWIDHADTHVRTWNYVTTLIETLQVRWNLMSGAYKVLPKDRTIPT
ncbi:MAG: dolichyl-phosphate beta-glucosyltransferase [Candidatus Promineifilaceae bacterium]|jgi:dolichyl-phosphate beta-glucosyltransferase